MTGDCYHGQPHLPGIRRRDGSLHCARCQQQLEAPSPDRAWGVGLEALRPDKGLKDGPTGPRAGSATGAQGRGSRSVMASNEAREEAGT